ncbi:response regulator [Myxococcota bacterium]|nr:response regulator [Myxococcota bacterium]
MTEIDRARPVLVVDDDDDIRESLLEVLGEQGFAVIGAKHGGAALEYLQQRESPPCLILLDLMMPVMDGAAFRARQLEEPALATVPVVVMAAYADADKKSEELQPAGILRKPLHLKTLIETIERFCPKGGSAG